MSERNTVHINLTYALILYLWIYTHIYAKDTSIAHRGTKLMFSNNDTCCDSVK